MKKGGKNAKNKTRQDYGIEKRRDIYFLFVTLKMVMK